MTRFLAFGAFLVFISACGHQGAESDRSPASVGVHIQLATRSAATCSQSDVQSAINAASVGDIIQVPAGNCSWSSLTLDKAVTLQGAGVGKTNVTVSGTNNFNKQSTGVTRITGFSFSASGGGDASHPMLVNGAWKNTMPIVFQNNAFTTNNNGMLRLQTPGGVIIAHNTFNGQWDDSFIQLKDPQDASGSWSAADTMGAKDTNGTLNHYIEDNTFTGGTNQGIDSDDASRVVYRHNSLTDSSFNSHGFDTSPVGIRHFEVYNNTFRNTQDSSQLANQNWAVWIRGATGVIYNNYFDNLAGSYWGDKPEIQLSIRGAEDVRPQGTCAQVSYPVPRQLGQNFNGTSYFTDPIYIWGNTGTVGINAGWGWGNPCGFTFSTFFQWGRDAVNGSMKPGYSAYTYPHPLVSGTTASASPAPSASASPTPIPSPSPSPSPALPSPSPAATISTTYPLTAIVSPLNGAVVPLKTTQSIKATVTDTVSVAKVEFYVNGSLKCSLAGNTTGNYACNFWVNKTPQSYSLQTKAYDSLGRIGASTPVTVYSGSAPTVSPTPAPTTSPSPATSPTPTSSIAALPQGKTGIASKHPGDVGVGSDPNVIFFDDFESYGSASDLWNRWSNVYQQSLTRIATETNNVFAGGKSLEFRVPGNTSEIANAVERSLSVPQDTVFVRVYTKFSAGFNAVGSYHDGIAITSKYCCPGVPADGTNKFYVDVENSRETTADASPGKTNSYVYYPEQRDLYGDHWYPDGTVTPYSSTPGNFGPNFIPRPNFIPQLDRWYSYELMVKANTPGLRDGRVAIWIDGNLIADFQNVRLRDTTSLMIDKVELDLYIKSNPTSTVNLKWYDNIIIAKSYIGPMS